MKSVAVRLYSKEEGHRALEVRTKEEETDLFRAVCLVLSLFSIGAGCAGAFAEAGLRISFADGEMGKPPAGWASRGGSTGDVYSIRAEGDKKFLHADARGTAIQIGYEREWSLADLPVLEWQWRALVLPDKGDERRKATNDSVLGVYVVFGRWPFVKAVKYVWSTTLPVGTCLDSPFSGRTKMVVLESGEALLGKWVVERRDVLADYRRLFGDAEAHPKARGIAILTDADNTASRASGDYGDIDILR